MTQQEQDIDYSSLERIVPDELTAGQSTGLETLRLHLDRYAFASRHLLSGNVLDIACGVGYGTNVLANQSGITGAIGVDISPAAISYAQRRYASERVSFICADANRFRPANQFVNIVSLETIEHVDDCGAFFSHLVSLLTPGGVLVGSVPITPSVDANPHHKRNFSIRSFRKLGEQHALEHVTCMEQVQPFNPFAIATRQEARSTNLRRNLPLFYLQNPSQFCLRLWSTVKDGFVNKYATVVWRRPL